MNAKPRRVDILVDGKKITTMGHKILIEIEGVPVFKSPTKEYSPEFGTSEFQVTTMQMLLKVAEATFAHQDRFRIVQSLVVAPKTFSELKALFNMTSPTLNYHLGKLSEAWVIYKTEGEKYAATLLGELLLSYFSKLLIETGKLQKELKLKEPIRK